MRVLTVRQPWAWAIIHGGKNVENRTRNIAGSYRGPVAIHAGKARFEDDSDMWEVRRAITSEINGWPASDSEVWAADMVDPDDERFVYGSIIGVVDLVDVHQSSECAVDADVDDRGPDTVHCSRWAMSDHHHLVLANPRPFAEPIPAKGRLGLWKPDADLLAEIENGSA